VRTEAYDGDPDEYFVLRHRSKRDIEREITIPRLWEKIKQFDSYQEAIRARDAMTAKHPGERFTVTTHKKPSVGESSVAEGNIEETIRKVKGGYRLYSKDGKKNLGTFDTRAGAEKHEREVQYFKHKGTNQQGVAEEKQKGVDGKACWKGYKRMGTKQKGGKTVDNCVKVREVTYEEVLSKLKSKLSDYLGDVAKAVKDTDLGDKSTTKSDRVNDVKTLMTDDGHEIRIRGNEDDGFRITIKNQDSKSKFSTIKEAEIAAKMYCKRRAGKPQLPQDYESER